MTNKRNKALQGLLLYPTKKEAAIYAGISESSLRRFLAEPEFQSELRKGYAEMVDSAAADLKRAMSPAVKALVDIVADPEQSGTVKTAASRALLEYGLRYSEFNDVLRLLNEEEQNVL